MTATWFLIGAAIGLTVATIYGYRRARHIYQRQLDTQMWPAESDGIYDWANDWDQAAVDELESWRP